MRHANRSCLRFALVLLVGFASLDVGRAMAQTSSATVRSATVELQDGPAQERQSRSADGARRWRRPNRVL